MGSLETGPSANTRNIGLRRAAVDPQRRLIAEVFGAGLTQSQTMASVPHDQGPLHGLHGIKAGEDARAGEGLRPGERREQDEVHGHDNERKSR